MEGRERSWESFPGYPIGPAPSIAVHVDSAKPEERSMPMLGGARLEEGEEHHMDW